MSDINEYTKSWIDILIKITGPVLINMANGTLKENMSVECVNNKRIKFSYLEAVGRVICGIAPWIELCADDTFEGKLRKKIY